MLLWLFLKFQKKKKTDPNESYRQAAKYSPENLKKLIFSTTVRPNWLKKGNRFWYKYKTPEGTNYYIVDADKRTKKELFDNIKMAEWLSEITKDPYDAQHLPDFKFKFVNNETAIRFRVTSKEKVPIIEKITQDRDSVQNDSINKKEIKTENKIYHFEYRLGGHSLHVVDNLKKEDKKWRRWSNVSPDSTIVLFTRKNNVFWMDKDNFLKAVKNEKDTTIVEHQWTKDGEAHFGHGTSIGKEAKDKDKRNGVWGYWSHDSKKFILEKKDSRMIKDLWVINSLSKKRPTLETFKYHMAGEKEFIKTEILIFDIPSKEIIKVKLDTTVQQSISVFNKPLKKANYTDEFRPTLLLSKKGDIYFRTISRDRKKTKLCVANSENGEVRVLIKEELNTYVDSRKPRLINNEKEIIHWSERDGWGHFYLYDSNGNFKSQITHGAYHCNYFEGLDETNQTMYFTANGVDTNIDPYYEHLYKINIDGTGLKVLNKGDYNTSISLGDTNNYFVNNYSRVNTIPASELRSSNGRLIMNLEKADLSQLFATGYKFPEPFKMKADDGVTDIYGVMYKPFNFNENGSYPILEYVYPGPQTESVSKSFSARMGNTDRMAQAGFIVITLGNRGGHPDRSKWYHNFGYGNLRDYGLADKKYVAEQLANKHRFINLNKVGIFGHSGGGSMSTAAMLIYPDFFKVAISSSGNHDNTVYNSWWGETHHGIKEEKDAEGHVNYIFNIDNNQDLAKNLKGKLMLVTGDIDNNVHPAATIRMANALIKSNKRFDFMMLPGQRHGFGSMNEYFFWLKVDYFSKHLLGVENTNIDMMEINRNRPKSEY